jgi:KipI family sensor histidine kinase inhibitor
VIRPFGEHALLVELDGWQAAQALAASLAAEPIGGVEAVVPGLASVLVELEPSAAGNADEIGSAVERRIARPHVTSRTGRIRTIPVVYGGEHGPDLDDVAAACELAPDELVARHRAVELRVMFCGFAPGFAYLGELPTELRVPRLATPRTRTPAGSVAVAGPMTGIYPADLPGGWRVIGRTPLRLFDPRREPPAYLAPGDVVRWRLLDGADWPAAPLAADDW